MRLMVTVVTLALTATTGRAQPADKPDYARAAEMYKQAESEMAVGQYKDAARDYAIAYDITKDPVLFFKIGSADDKIGRCDLALTYYRRYLAEGKPDADYQKLTSDRITACEQSGGKHEDVVVPPESTAVEPTHPAVVDDSTAQLTGHHDERPSLSDEHPSRARSAAWIIMGVGVAIGTAGVVSAISANAAEKDLQDLYDVRVNGRPADFTPEVAKRYDDLISQGKRYEKLSWIAFGTAGVALIGATVLFVASAGHQEQPPPVALQVTGHGAAVVGGWSF